MTDPISRVLSSYPAKFFHGLSEHTDAAFAKAYRLTHRDYAEPERANMLGQMRHALCEEGFRMAAQDAGLKAAARHTRPAGGRYSVVSHGDVYMIRGNVQSHCGTPRPTRFRSEWAALNAWLDPLQLDLLKAMPEPSADRLCGIIVVTAHRRTGGSGLPAFVGLGIPRSDLSGWVILEPIRKLLGLYHDLETRILTPAEAEITVKDRAFPRVKKTSGGGPENQTPATE